jgi:predicted transcriptional regulator
MKERLSVTVDSELCKEVKKVAEERNETVSHLVEEAIREWKRDEVREELKAYYVAETSVEQGRIVREGESIIDEVWEGYSED